MTMDSNWASSPESRNSFFGFGPNRRNHRRYNSHLDLRWKVISRRRVLDVGEGRTLDISRGGVLFESGRHIPVGLHVELTINWPARLDNVQPLQLVVFGCVVRASDNRIAIQTLRFAFSSLGLTVSRAIALRAVSDS
jgi:hypothetical protein